MDAPIIDPDKVPALIAGGFGAFVSILFQRGISRLAMFTTLASAEVVDYYFARPVWEALHNRWNWSTEWQGPVAFTIGLLAIFVVGGVTKMAADFGAEPWGTIGGVLGSVLKRILPRKFGE